MDTLLIIASGAIIAAFGAVWAELRAIRKRLHSIEGEHKLAEEILLKYKLIRREDRDPYLDNLISQHERKGQ